MKRFIIMLVLLAILALTGCRQATWETMTEVVTENLFEWHDDKYNQTCWIYTGTRSAAITCTPDWMLTPPTDTAN